MLSVIFFAYFVIRSFKDLFMNRLFFTFCLLFFSLNVLAVDPKAAIASSKSELDDLMLALLAVFVSIGVAALAVWIGSSALRYVRRSL